VGVVGGVEEVLMVELAEDDRHQDVAGGDCALGIGFLDGFEAGEGAIVVEGVEVVVGFADPGGEVDGVGVGGGVVLLRGGRGVEQEGEEEDPKCFLAVIYRCSPERQSRVCQGLLLV
jgi:hypothetical protein